MNDLPTDFKRIIRKSMKMAYATGHESGRAQVIEQLRLMADLNGSGLSVLKALTRADRHTKSFDESKHPRDHGKFTATTGTPHPVTPHLHALAGKVQSAPDRKAAADAIRGAAPDIRRAEREHEKGLVKQAKEKAKAWAAGADTGARVRKPLGSALARLLADDPDIHWGQDDEYFSHRPTDALRDAHTQMESGHGPAGAAAHLARLAGHPHHETRVGVVPHWDREGTPDQYRRQAAEQMLDDDDFRAAVEKHLGYDASDEDAYDANYESHRAAAVQHVAGLLADWDRHVEEGYGKVSKGFDSSKHPRGDGGKFIDAHHIAAAAKDPKKAAELRAQVTDPEQRAKLDAAIEHHQEGWEPETPWRATGKKPDFDESGRPQLSHDVDPNMAASGFEPIRGVMTTAGMARAAGREEGAFAKQGDVDHYGTAYRDPKTGRVYAHLADYHTTNQRHIQELNERVARHTERLKDAPAEVRNRLERYLQEDTSKLAAIRNSYDPDVGKVANSATAGKTGDGDANTESAAVEGTSAQPESRSDKPSSPSPAPGKRPTVDQSEALARRLMGANGPTTAETVKRLQEAFGQHTKKELEQLKQRLGIRAGGSQEVMAKRLAERAAAYDRSNRNLYVNEKVSVDDAHAKITAMAADGSLRTPQGVTELTKMIAGGMTGDELKELKGRLGIKASGAKMEVARKLVERATKEKATAAPPAGFDAATLPGGNTPVTELDTPTLEKRHQAIAGALEDAKQRLIAANRAGDVRAASDIMSGDVRRIQNERQSIEYELYGIPDGIREPRRGGRTDRGQKPAEPPAAPQLTQTAEKVNDAPPNVPSGKLPHGAEIRPHNGGVGLFIPGKRKPIVQGEDEADLRRIAGRITTPAHGDGLEAVIAHHAADVQGRRGKNSGETFQVGDKTVSRAEMIAGQKEHLGQADGKDSRGRTLPKVGQAVSKLAHVSASAMTSSGVPRIHGVLEQEPDGLHVVRVTHTSNGSGGVKAGDRIPYKGDWHPNEDTPTPPQPLAGPPTAGTARPPAGGGATGGGSLSQLLANTPEKGHSEKELPNTSAPDHRRAFDMTADERKAEADRIRRDEREALSTLLASEGGVSPAQIGRMSPKQHQKWQQNGQKRLILEARLRELAKPDDVLAKEKEQHASGQVEDKVKRKHDYLRTILGMAGPAEPGKPNMFRNAKGELKPKYQHFVDDLKASLNETHATHPDIAAKYGSLVGWSPSAPAPTPPQPLTGPPTAGTARPPAGGGNPTNVVDKTTDVGNITGVGQQTAAPNTGGSKMTTAKRFALINTNWLTQQRAAAGVMANPEQRAAKLAEIDAAEQQHQDTLAELGRRGYIRNRFPFTSKDGKRIQGGSGWAVKDATGKWRNLTSAEAAAELNAGGDKPTDVGNISGVGSQSAVPSTGGSTMSDELPELRGSQKQTEWASKIRDEFIASHPEHTDKAARVADAGDWIDAKANPAAAVAGAAVGLPMRTGHTKATPSGHRPSMFVGSPKLVQDYASHLGSLMTGGADDYEKEWPSYRVIQAGARAGYTVPQILAHGRALGLTESPDAVANAQRVYDDTVTPSWDKAGTFEWTINNPASPYHNRKLTGGRRATDANGKPVVKFDDVNGKTPTVSADRYPEMWAALAKHEKGGAA